MTTPVAAPPRRSAAVAALLTGLGPGAGHLHVGHPVRGGVLLLLLCVACVAWVRAVPVSYDAARLLLLVPCVLVLAMILDAARLARRDPRQLPRIVQSWPACAVVVAVTGFALPSLFMRHLERRVGVHHVADTSMAPAVGLNDRVVVDRADPPRRPLRRGDVVVVRGGAGPVLRRVVGLPGEEVELRRGLVHVRAQAWLSDADRASRRAGAARPPTVAGHGEVLVLADLGPISAEEPRRVALSRIDGRAAWILLPGDLDPLRVGAPVE